MRLWIPILILLCASSAAAQCPVTPPATYLSDTSRTVFSNAVVPNFGNTTGQGIILTDTTYYAPGLRTERITDEHTNWGPFDDSHVEGSFNCDSTYFYVNDESGDYKWYTFNTTTMAYAIASNQPQNHLSGDSIASVYAAHTDPNLVYIMVWDGSDNHAKFTSFNLSTGTYTILYDPKTSDIPTLGAFGNSLGVSEDDNCLSGNIDGAQDVRRYFLMWCANTQGGYTAGARWLDGTTGVLAGWGPHGTITSGVRWGGHASQVLGRYNTITIGQCLAGSPCTNNGDGLIWDILASSAATSIQFFALTTPDYPINVEGHFTTDVNALLVDASVINGGAFDRTSRTIDSAQANFNIANANRVDLIPTKRSPDTFNSDAHNSWGNNRVGRSEPVFFDLQYQGCKVTAISRSSNVVTVTCDVELFCSTIDTMVIRNVTGGATSFDGSFAVATNNANCSSFTFAQSGPNESGTVDITSSAAPISVHPWDDELIALATDGSNIMYRFAHMYGNTLESPFFFLQTSNHVSPDGRWLLWHTDMRQSYGLDAAGITRVDVMVTELPATAPATSGNLVNTGTKVWTGTIVR